MVSGGSGGGNKGRTKTHSYDAAVKARHALVCFSRIHASCSFQNASISATLSAGTDQTMWMQGRFSSTLRVDMLGGDETKKCEIHGGEQIECSNFPENVREFFRNFLFIV